jgi:hypothetical protein
MANNHATKAFDCDDAVADDKSSVTVKQDSEIARIWKTFEDIGSGTIIIYDPSIPVMFTS